MRRHIFSMVAVLTLILAGLAAIGSAHPAFAAGGQVADCTFATLQADLQSGGDWYYAAGQCPTPITAPCTIDIDPNTCTIDIDTNASLTARGNDVTLDGGGIVRLFFVESTATFALTGLTLSGGRPNFSGGGAFYNAGALIITNSTLSGNDAPFPGADLGGAIFNHGALTISNSTLSRNSALFQGGAIYDASGSSMRISNSTLSSNSSQYGGAIAIDDYATLTISNSTLSRNSASYGGAIGNQGTVVTATISGSIVAGNGGGNCFSPLTDQGYNLESGTDCGLTGTHSLQNTDPQLDPLADNGGPTQTMALQLGSPAIDAIPTASGLCPATDQRGFARPDVGELQCDIGAYEHYDPAAVTSVSPRTASPGSTVTLTVNGTGFSAASSVSFLAIDGLGQTVIPNPTVISDSQLKVTVSTSDLPGNGRYDVVVTTACSATVTSCGSSDQAAADEFTLLPQPTISGVSPGAVQAHSGAPTTLTVSGANFENYPGGTDPYPYPALTALVRWTAPGGQPVTLTPTSIASDGSSLTVNLPANLAVGTGQLAVVNPAPGSDGSSSTIWPVFITATATSLSAEQVSNTGSASAGGVTVTASGGSGTIAVATYSDNPGGTPSFTSAGAYFDAYVTPGSSYTSVTIKDCALGSGQTIAYWWNGTQWVRASNQSYDSSTGCITVTITSSTSPNLTQLGGTSFGVGGKLLQSISFTGPATQIIGTPPVTVTATASSALPVSFTAGPTSACTSSGPNGSTITLVGVGTCTVTASQAGSDIYAAAPNVQQSFAIQYAPAGTTCLGAPSHQVLPPINADGSSIFRAGSTVPVQFRVCDANGTSIGTPGVVTSFTLVSTSADPNVTVNTSPTPSTPDTAFRWDATNQQWIFNLSTKEMTGGTKYVYRITLNDGTTITFSFALK